MLSSVSEVDIAVMLSHGADLVVAAAAQVVCPCRGQGRGQWSGHLLGHGGSVGGAPQQVVHTAMGSIVRSWFQTQKI